jgi:hypothetical protein
VKTRHSKKRSVTRSKKCAPANVQADSMYRASDPARLVDIGLLAQLRAQYRRFAPPVEARV